MNSRKELDHALQRCQQAEGPLRYWRSLEELADLEAFQQLLKSEFPEQADIWPESLSRRKFVALMAASLALGGLSGCSVQPAPAEKIVPYVHPPGEIVAGRPLFFATTMVHGGDAVGLLVESHQGRPTKVEGNPDHPASRGATNAFHQASVLGLYDPDRLQTVSFEDEIRTWDQAENALRAALSEETSRKGSGLRILSEPIRSPTLAAQRQRLLDRFPQAKWHEFEPINHDLPLEGARLAFGRPASPVYDFTAADVVLSLDADFLAAGPGHLRYARDFMQSRRAYRDAQSASGATMNRLYVAETSVSCTGAKADHRLAISGREIEELARAIADEVGATSGAQATTRHQRWVQAVAKDLSDHQGRCLVLAGRRQPPAVHALVHAINDKLGNTGKTVRFVEPVAATSSLQSLRELIEDIDRGEVQTLIVLGGNPAYNAPADLDFAQRLAKVPLRFHWSLYADETSQLCQWHLPAAHYLESWSDARAFDGTASIVQPLIRPLYQGRSAHEFVALLTGEKQTKGDEIVREYWRRAADVEESEFDDWWQTALHDGVIADSAFAALDVSLRDDWQPATTANSSVARADQLELHIDADPTIHDGEFANNGWLQELPKPLTKLTWDNAVLISPTTAAALGVDQRQFAHGGEHGGYEVPLVDLQVGENSVRGPVWITPGHADGAVTIHLGYGRRAAGRIGGNRDQTLGFNAYELQISDQPWTVPNVDLRVTSERYSLACTQAHHSLDGRDVIRSGSLAEYRDNPKQVGESDEPHHSPETESGDKSLYDTQHLLTAENQWGMVIDLTACTGCSACVVACQAENNIPVVGKEQVLFGREMHWLRIDRYLSGEAESPDAMHFQPLPCMHCEHAPCEYVCPVMATVHSADGLNDMVYNRCVGTRFCSNNCPYKVRRFNFLAYSDFETVSLRLQYNPDVTVRSRGVMEKCSYCVQRIRAADADAAASGRAIRDGDILTACQAACPAQAINFGNISDPKSEVSLARQSPLHYSLLEELNTLPRTTYLAELRNPNPDLEGA